MQGFSTTIVCISYIHSSFTSSIWSMLHGTVVVYKATMSFSLLTWHPLLQPTLLYSTFEHVWLYKGVRMRILFVVVMDWWDSHLWNHKIEFVRLYSYTFQSSKNLFIKLKLKSMEIDTLLILSDWRDDILMKWHW